MLCFSQTKTVTTCLWLMNQPLRLCLTNTTTVTSLGTPATITFFRLQNETKNKRFCLSLLFMSSKNNKQRKTFQESHQRSGTRLLWTSSSLSVSKTWKMPRLKLRLLTVYNLPIWKQLNSHPKLSWSPSNLRKCRIAFSKTLHAL